MAAKSTFKVCRNCRKECSLKVRLCTGCGEWTRTQRRAGAKSYFDLATPEQMAAKAARNASLEATMVSLLAVHTSNRETVAQLMDALAEVEDALFGSEAR